MGRAKVRSVVLTRLQGAVARSRTKVPSGHAALATPLGPRPVRSRVPGRSHARTSAAPAADVPPYRTEEDDRAEFERNTQQAIAQSAAQLADRHDLLSRDPTDEQAFEFAQLLRAGVPQPDALCYVLGSVEAGIIEAALPRWLRSRGVVDALAHLNGGKWPALEPDARLDLALDKHYAELAHYLYTHDYDSADGKVMRKLDTARESLERLRVGRMQENSPFVKFLRTLLAPAPAPALPAAEAEVPGQGRGDATRPATLGLVEVEATVEGEVTETVDEV